MIGLMVVMLMSYSLYFIIIINTLFEIGKKSHSSVKILLSNLYRVTTSGIPKSQELRFVILWQSLNHFLVHQIAATNFMHLKSTHTHATFTDSHLESSWRSVVELSCGSSQRVKTIGCFCRGAPSLLFDRILNAALSQEVSNIETTEGNL